MIQDITSSNWAVESFTIDGSGVIQLSGTSSGFIRFSQGFADGATVFYALHDSNDDREAGWGVYSSNSITRTAVTATLLNGVYNETNPQPLAFINGGSAAGTFNALAFDNIWTHIYSQSNPHNVQAVQVPYDDSALPTLGDNVQAAIDALSLGGGDKSFIQLDGTPGAWGSPEQILKLDNSGENLIWTTANTISDTLDDVTSRGNTTANTIDVGGIISNGPASVAGPTGTLTVEGLTTTAGLLSARTGSGADALSIGPEAGLTNQGGLSVAVGYRAGKTNQSSDSVAIGEDAGREDQSDYSVAIGSYAGETNQGSESIAIGDDAGNTDQSNEAIAIGYSAGSSTQGEGAIAVGTDAGNDTQGDNSVAIGTGAGNDAQGASGIIINSSGNTLDDSTVGHVHIASSLSSLNYQNIGGVENWNFSSGTVNAPAFAGDGSLLTNVPSAVDTLQAVTDAGATTTNSINTGGLLSARSDAGTTAFSVGSGAGASLQQANSVAVGTSAGSISQGKANSDIAFPGPAVAIGVNSGRFFQERYATAVGMSAGETNQGEYAVAIGYAAGDSNQGNNGIIVNSSGTVVDDSSLGHIRLVSNRGELKFTSSGGWEMIDGGITYLNVPATGGLSVTGTTTSTAFVGDGSGLTNLPAGATNTLEQVTTAGNTTTNDIAFADNAKATFGADPDLQIYHSATNSYIQDTGTGSLYIQGSSNILLGSNTQNNLIIADGGAVTARYNGVNTLATTATGIDVTGTATMDGLTVASSAPLIEVTDTDTPVTTFVQSTGSQGRLGTSTDHDMFVYVAGAQHTRFRTNGDVSFYDAARTSAKMTWDASSESLGIGTSTPASKLDVNGTATMAGLTVESVSNASLRVSDSTNPNQRVDLQQNGGVTSFISGNNGAYGTIEMQAYNGTSTVDRLKILANGNVNFYEDTGVTAKMVWSSSAEQLEITGRLQTTGTLGNWSIDTTGAVMNYTRPSANYIRASVAGGFLSFQTGGTNERLKVSDTGIDVTGSADVTTSAVNNQTMATFNTSGGVRAVINTDSDDDGAFSLYDKNDAVKVFLRSTGASYLMGGDIGINNNVPDNKLSVLDAGPSAAALLASGNYAAMFGSNTNSAAGITQGIMISGGDNNTRGVALLAETQNSDNRTDFIIATSGSAATPTEKMRITNAGNVGVGTTIPTNKLVVSNSNAEGIEFNPAASAGVNNTIHYNRSGATYVVNRTLASQHEWHNGSANEVMRIDSTGIVNVVNRITIADKPVYANNDTGLSSANVYFSNGVAPVSGDGADGDIWYQY